MGIVHLTTAGGHKWSAPVSQIVNWHEPVPGLEAPGAKCVVITQNEKIAVRETHTGVIHNQGEHINTLDFRGSRALETAVVRITNGYQVSNKPHRQFRGHPWPDG